MRLVLALLGAVLLHQARAFRYDTLSIILSREQYLQSLSEEPMYDGGVSCRHRSTLGLAGKLLGLQTNTSHSEVGASLVAKTDMAEPDLLALGATITTMLLDEDSIKLVGYPPKAFPAAEAIVCCSPGLYASNDCGTSNIGEVILFPGTAPPRTMVSVVTQTTAIEFSAQTKRSGRQWLVHVACSESGDVPTVTLTGVWTFKNPYGYLPGGQYGELWYYGAMFVAYLATLLLFGVWLYVQREHAIHLQFFLILAALLGLMEVSDRREPTSDAPMRRVRLAVWSPVLR
jgi:hypothetical protein